MNDCINMPLTELKGIGPKKSQLFGKLGIFDVKDALYSFPRDYEDRRNIKKIGSLVGGEDAMVRGTVSALKKGRYVRGRKRTTRLLVKDDTGAAEVLFFNAPYIEKSVKIGDEYWFYGKINKTQGGISMIHPEFRKAEGCEEQEGILPIYPLTAGMSQNERRKLSAQAVGYIDDSLEYLREDTREINQVCGIEYEVKNMHYTDDEKKIVLA